ncbi:PREDICTED: probable lysophospholipase BODYGUARD 2 [Tarenaya hassleriana]|uniref:probable lysophospholipase BODYGUARD 2 n=1 Tax=Tarenaya hassleriana TaxID=28532 RepID=UPI00053CA25E|nr:PREDICTED: probable lysophospholipase BODYGUARD 2 [Tarenaya hassleriana]
MAATMMMMMMMSKTRWAVTVLGRFLNETVSLVVFCVLDIIDCLLCLLYKAADYLLEAEWKPCYCLSAKEPITTTRGKILVSHNNGESNILTLSPPQELSSRSKIQLEEISDTLYSRASLISELSKLSVDELSKRLPKVRSEYADHEKARKKGRGKRLTVNFTVVEMLQGKIRPQNLNPVSRWSDCDCGFCTCWASSCRKDQSLFVKTQIPKGNTAKEDVLFIHGFISSSAFWSETVFSNLSSSAKANYRLFAVDLLGFGKSPKPADSLYTLREHLEMIEKSVLQKYNVKSFHVVAHSLGCILALGLAVRHGGSVKSLTLLAPPYYPVPKEEAEPTQYVMRKVAPRRVWPPISFGASMACWYEHISRTICLLICKNHRLWEFLAKLITRNRIRTFLMEGFFCHTHNAAWHTLHNIICGTGSKLHTYLDIVRDKLDCHVTIFHGRDDEVIPLECSFDVQRRVPRAKVKVVENKDHITIVVGRQKAFARELEEIWNGV